MLKLATFVIFGSLLVFEPAVRVTAPAARAFVAPGTVCRAHGGAAARLIGTRLDWPQRWFMAWFGPKGVACIAYSLLVLSRGVPGAERIFNLTALVVVASIILHGASDTPLANWFGGRSQLQRRPSAGETGSLGD